jgi:hypothetical protein
MKVNSVNIQAYQQIGRREQSVPPKADGEQKQPAQHVAIEPQSKLTGSKLAVKAPSKSYAEVLTPEERQSLDALFAKYRDSGRFGTSYQAESAQETAEPTVGRIVDVKV